MSNKSIQKVAMLFTFLSLSSVVVPGIVSSQAYADSITSSDVAVSAVRKLSEDEQKNIIKELKTLHPEVSDYFITETVKRQSRGDFRPVVESIKPGERMFFLGIWDNEGMTVAAAGAALDATIALLTGGGLAAIKSMPVDQAKGIIKKAIIKVFGSDVAPWVLGYILAFFSPGRAFAEWWDSQDAYPNNGHINF